LEQRGHRQQQLLLRKWMLMLSLLLVSDRTPLLLRLLRPFVALLANPPAQS
jgi:hypothetical protein